MEKRGTSLDWVVSPAHHLHIASIVRKISSSHRKDILVNERVLGSLRKSERVKGCRSEAKQVMMWKDVKTGESQMLMNKKVSGSLRKSEGVEGCGSEKKASGEM